MEEKKKYKQYKGEYHNNLDSFDVINPKIMTVGMTVEK